MLLTITELVTGIAKHDQSALQHAAADSQALIQIVAALPPTFCSALSFDNLKLKETQLSPTCRTVVQCKGTSCPLPAASARALSQLQAARCHTCLAACCWALSDKGLLHQHLLDTARKV
jgi:hypothetical protein